VNQGLSEIVLESSRSLRLKKIQCQHLKKNNHYSPEEGPQHPRG
jgi:hypothetical protein